MFPLSFTCLPHNLTFSAGSVKRARQRLRRCFGSNWGASEECWLAGLRCWPRPSDRPHTTEGLLGPGSGMTMCADLDPAPRPPTLTKDTTLALDCTSCTLNKVYSRVSSDYAIWPPSYLMQNCVIFMGKSFRGYCSIVNLVGVVGAGKGHKVAAKTTHDDCSGPG